MIKLSDGTEIDPATIKEVWVNGPEGKYNLWYTYVRTYWKHPAYDQYALSHETREQAMAESDRIHEEARKLGVFIGVR